MKTEFVIGSRESELALIQTNHVKQLLETKYPQYTFRIVSMTTTGDQIQKIPLQKIGTKALFTKELEIALEENRVDFIVHSLKDVPTELPNGMILGGIMNRKDPRDVVIMNPSHSFKTLQDLPNGSVIGTSSVRRKAQLKKQFPELIIKDVVLHC
jgi:hydroxymethylbilane synthase